MKTVRSTGSLIKVELNAHDEMSFHYVSHPAIDIQTERRDIEYSEFWAPVRQSGLFAGKPVPLRNESWITKGIQGMTLELLLRNHSCYVLLDIPGDDRIQRRDDILELFPEQEFSCGLKESAKSAKIVFEVLDKGKKDKDDWPEIRSQLVAMGEKVYNRIKNKNADV